MKSLPSFSSLVLDSDLGKFEDEYEGRVRRRWGSLFILLGMMLICSFAQAQDPQAFARSSIEPTIDIWAGQKVTWVVELVVPGFFAGTPSFNLPDVSGLLILSPAGSPTVGSEQSKGVNQSVQRFEFSVFAQKGGDFQIPPMTVRLAFKRDPLDAQPTEQSVQTPSVSFFAKVPPGAEKVGTILSARDLQLEESWKPGPGKAKTGAAFVRSIVFSASDIPAMAFPPFFAPPIEGLGIYQETPEVLDQTDRGQLLGRRRETITYVCEKPGTYNIPAYEMTWWNPSDQKLETIRLPKYVIRVEGGEAATTSGIMWVNILSAAAGLIFLIGAGFGIRKFPLLVYVRRILSPWRPVRLSRLNPSASDKI